MGQTWVKLEYESCFLGCGTTRDETVIMCDSEVVIHWQAVNVGRRFLNCRAWLSFLCQRVVRSESLAGVTHAVKIIWYPGGIPGQSINRDRRAFQNLRIFLDLIFARLSATSSADLRDAIVAHLDGFYQWKYGLGKPRSTQAGQEFCFLQNKCSQKNDSKCVYRLVSLGHWFSIKNCLTYFPSSLPPPGIGPK